MIVWNYKDADPEFGNWQAKELTSHLEHVFCNLPIEIVQGKKCLEIIPNQLKKVSPFIYEINHIHVKLVKFLLETFSKKFPLDFVLFIGDDNGNEPVFTYLNNKKQQSSRLLTGVSFKFFAMNVNVQTASVYTCTVGRRATQAKYFLNDSDAFYHMIQSLQTISIKARKNKSYADLRSSNSQAHSMGTGSKNDFYRDQKRQGSDALMKRVGTQLIMNKQSQFNRKHDNGTPQQKGSGVNFAAGSSKAYNDIDSLNEEDEQDDNMFMSNSNHNSSYGSLPRDGSDLITKKLSDEL